MSSATVALSITPALPAEFANIGVMEILGAGSNTYRVYRWTVIGGGNRGVLEIEYQNGTWTTWRRTDYDPKPRTVPNGANIDTYVRSSGAFDGEWITLTGIATNGITGTPAGETGMFHLRVSGSTGFQMIQFYNGGLYWRCINSVSGGTFGPWVRL
ncbi:hypothetical protein, partial [Pantoea sp. ANP04]|uniref:hypothetical protein n=1 Tax=Pantoea sp. ANP04 TaxID=3064896 RepID=UPI0035C56A1A